MPFELSVSADKTIVIFRPNQVGESHDEFVRRRDAIGACAARHGLSKLLLDYRGKSLSLDKAFFEVVISSPGLKIRAKWRIAILISIAAPSYTVELATGLAEVLQAMGQDALQFFEYSLAVDWLTGNGLPPA
jgi:hypothetical protein